jgi:TPR repeat protein
MESRSLPQMKTNELMKWYYLSKNNEVIGPVSETALGELKACGIIKNDTRICREGTEDWITFAEVSTYTTAAPDIPGTVKFHCPHCSQHIVADASHAGMETQCPSCSGKLLVPKVLTSHPSIKKVTNYARHKVLILLVLGLAGLLAIVWFVFNVGLGSYGGKRVPQDKQKAVEWYRKAAEQGQAEAQFMMGDYYAKGEGVPEDDEKAAEWFRKAAEQGYARAQCMLGNLYQSGEGVPENRKEATKWYRKAAEQGDTEAQRNMGQQYSVGFGVQQDGAESVKWYHKAALKGDMPAQIALGVHYRDGTGVPRDDVKAAKWFLKAAEQGAGVAQETMGLRYAQGLGVPKDDVEAAKWFRKAAEQGAEASQVEMGLRYEQGLGVPKDDVEAVKWFRKIAKEASSPVIYNMGRRYARGHGVPRDLAKAYMWLSLANAKRAGGAKEELENVAKLMTKDQIAEAQKFSHEWMEKNVK